MPIQKLQKMTDFQDTHHLPSEPLQAGLNVRKAVVHLIGSNGKAVACSWKFNAQHGFMVKDNDDLTIATTERTKLCEHCFHAFALPTTWETGLNADPCHTEDDEEYDDDSGMSESSQSEFED